MLNPEWTNEELIEQILIELAINDVPFMPLPHQLPPEGDWFMWLMEAGRGAGKTAAAAHYMQDHLNGPACGTKALPHRTLLVAPTIGDGIESAYLNDQALTRLEPGAKFTTSAGGARVFWPNGSQVRVIGAYTREDIERLRAAGNNCMVWAEELAAWRYMSEAWEIMLPGLRIGPNPRIVATTTPKPRPEYVAIREQATKITHATTLENPNLNEAMKQRLIELYGDTSIGRQELYGMLVDEAEGALWTTSDIDADRFDDVPTLGRVVVAIDPPGGATEAGIVAAGLIPNCPCGGDRQPHFAVIGDVSGKVDPEVWAMRAVDLLDEWGGDRLVGEKNYGGDMVESVIRNVAPDVPYKNVTASRSKRLRAEPVKALYEQHRVHHIGSFAELESQMVQWIPDDSKWSPDRVDALVWAITDLAGFKARVKMHGWTLDPDLRKQRGA
jgi:phage terminase large subunit-like protein